jgi:hypothetical protein
MTDREWAEHSANQSVDGNGLLVIAPRPMEPAHIPITNGLTNAQISVAKYSNDRHLVWHDAKAALKADIIRCLGPTLASTIGPPPTGFTTLTIQHIVNAVKTLYGTVDEMALNKMEDILASPLDCVANLDKHLATMRQHILMQTTAGYSIEEYRKVRIFWKAILGHPLLTGILRDFDHENTDPLLHTYDAYVKKHLPSLRAAADMASASGMAFSVTEAKAMGSSSSTPRTAEDMNHAELLCAFSVLEHKHKNLKQRQKKTGKRGKQQRESDAPITAVDCSFYCHAHGFQNSHTSAQCKVMANQKQNFTAEMRRATGPHSPTGGSKLVRGREPTVQGQANMMRSVDDTDAETDTPPTTPAQPPAVNDSNDEGASCALPIMAPPYFPSSGAGVFDDEYVGGKRKRASSPTLSSDTLAFMAREAPANQRPASSDSSIVSPPAPITQPTLAPGDDSSADPTRVSFEIREGWQSKTTLYIDLTSVADRHRLGQRIFDSLRHVDWKPDFESRHIPPRDQDAAVHDYLHGMLARRHRTERSIEANQVDEALDDTRLERDEAAVEVEYHKLNHVYNEINRAMLTAYAQYLTVTPRTGTGIEGTALLATEVTETAAPSEESPCPYSHIRDHPAPPPTKPTFAPFIVGDGFDQALFTERLGPRNLAKSRDAVWAIADSGASHVLIKATDAHILTDREYTVGNAPVFAELKAANGTHLSAIGRDNLATGSISLVAYIFDPRDLVNNLLGLAPYADRNCTTTFKPASFLIYQGDESHPLLVGTRDKTRALCLVDLNANLPHAPNSNGIPPPHPPAPTRANRRQSSPHEVYIEASHVGEQDNASYVRFVHASLGYPAPTTFLRAVIAGHITGRHQLPRLTAKMVRKHIPNAMATAKGHLDRKLSSLPHAQSDAVSALRRHHTREAQAQKQLGTKTEPFSLTGI